MTYCKGIFDWIDATWTKLAKLCVPFVVVLSEEGFNVISAL